MEKKQIKIENWDPKGEIIPFLRENLSFGKGKSFINNQKELNSIQTLAEKIFSPKNSKKIEVIMDSSLLAIRVSKKKASAGLAGWFSLVEVKRFYELCEKDLNISFRFPWEMTSLDFENKDFIEIYFHLI